MSYKPSDTVIVEFCTSNSGGAATNADSLPTGTVNRNGTDDGAVTVTVVNIDTGRYKATFTLPGGYVSGDSVSLSVSATVGGTTGKKAWGPWALDGKRVSDLQDLSATAAATATQTGLTAQGYTGARATKLDNLDATVSSRMASFTLPANFAAFALDGSGRVQVQSGTGAGQIDLSAGAVTVGGYAAGQDPATLLASSFGAIPSAAANGAAALNAIAVSMGNSDGTQILNTLYNNASTAATASGNVNLRLTSARAAKLDNLDATVSSRNSVAPDNASIAAIAAKTGNLPASPAAVGSAMTLTSSERDSIAAALLDLSNGVETGLTVRQALRLLRAVLAGKATEASGTYTFYRPDGSTAALTVVHDALGTRSTVTVGTL